MANQGKWDSAQGKWESIALPKYVVWALVSPVLIFGFGALSYDYFSEGEYLLCGVMAVLALFGTAWYKADIFPAALSVLTRSPFIGIYPDRLLHKGVSCPWSEAEEVRMYVEGRRYQFRVKRKDGKTSVNVDLLTGSTDPEEGFFALLGTLKTHHKHLYATCARSIDEHILS